MPPPYTLTDHSKAKAKLQALQAKWENYSGNNPNKFQAEIADAMAELHWSYPDSVDSDQGIAVVSLRVLMNCCS